MTLFPTWTSPGSGDSGPQFGLTWTWGLSSPLEPNSELLNHAPPRPHPDLVTLVPSYASIRPDESGPHVGLHGPGTQLDLRLSWIEWLWFPQGDHLILLTVVLFYASPGPSDSVCHLGLHGPSDSAPHPGIIGTWIIYSTPAPHFDQGPLVPFWASN